MLAPKIEAQRIKINQHTKNTMESTPKRVRSQAPDVVVSVGRGDAKREFECYKIALSFASPYFDAMFSTDMTENHRGRVEFPDKHPAEWELFYSFIDPSLVGDATRSPAAIKEDNAMVLTPWFHEFAMQTHVSKCDRVLANNIKAISRMSSCDSDEFWPRDANKSGARLRQRRSVFEQILKLLQCACIYDLKATKASAEEVIKVLTPGYLFIRATEDLFDLPSVKILVDLFLPVKTKEEVQGKPLLEPCGKSTTFWDSLEYLSHWGNLPTLSAETINSNGEMLALLIHTLVQGEMDKNRAILAEKQVKKQTKKVGEIQALAQTVVGDLVKKCPNRLRENAKDRNAAAKLTMIMQQEFKRNKGDYEKLGISNPDPAWVLSP